MKDREKTRGVNGGEEIEKRESRREAGRKRLRGRGRSERKSERKAVGGCGLREVAPALMGPFTMYDGKFPWLFLRLRKKKKFQF